MKDINTVKEELALASHRAYQRGIQVGSGGNVSARVPGQDLMMIKPSGSSFMDCTADSWIITDFDGNVVEGEGKPSGEILLHGEIYKKNPKAMAVVHCHSSYANMMALFHDELPVYAWHSTYKQGGFTPVLDVKNPGVEAEDFPLVDKVFEDNPDCKSFILRRHGLVAIGKDPLDAEHVAELIEETAQTAFTTMVYSKLTGVDVDIVSKEWYENYLRKYKGKK